MTPRTKALIAKWEAMDLDDRDAVKKFMQGEKPMFTVAATISSRTKA